MPGDNFRTVLRPDSYSAMKIKQVLHSFLVHVCMPDPVQVLTLSWVLRESSFSLDVRRVRHFIVVLISIRFDRILYQVVFILKFCDHEKKVLFAELKFTALLILESHTDTKECSQV